MTASRTVSPRVRPAEDATAGERVTFGKVGEQPGRPGWNACTMLLDGIQIAWIEERHGLEDEFAWFAFPLSLHWELLLEVSDCETRDQAMAEARALVEERL